MAMSCEQIDEQMMDFLYGELSPDARAAFEAHLPGCERCRREVESFGHTRALARTALDEAPPAHLRARVVAAARAALPAKAVPVSPPRGASWWDRIRGWWTLPTLATVGALAVFLLGSRLFMSQPQQLALRGREISGRVSSQEPAPAEAPPEPALRLDHLSPARSEVEGASSGAPVTGPPPYRQVAKRHASAAAPRAGQAARSIADDLGGLGAGPGRAGGGASASASKPAPAKKGAYRDDPLDGLLSGSKASARPAAAQAPSAVTSGDFADDELEKSSATPALSGKLANKKKREPSPEPLEGFAKDEAPAQVVSAPRRPAAVAEDLAQAEPASDKASRFVERESSDLSDEEAPARRRSAPAPTTGKGYPAPTAPAAAAAPSPPPAPPAPAVASSVSRPRAEAKASKSRANDAKPDAPPAETLVQRADRLFTEGRWVEAVVAYHDLLRQSPSSPDAPRWRRRMAAAEAAIKANPPQR